MENINITTTDGHMNVPPTYMDTTQSAQAIELSGNTPLDTSGRIPS